MIRSTITYGVAGMLPALLGFVLLPFYSKHLSTSEYGIIAAMGVLSAVLSVVSNMSLDRAAFRFYFDNNEPTVRRKLLGTFFIGSIGVSVLCFGLMLLAQPLLTHAYPEIAFYPYCFFTIVTISLGVCEVFVMGYFRISEKPRAYLLMIFMQLCLQGGFIFYFVLVKEQGALGQVRALLTASLILLPVYLVVAYKNFALSFNWDLFKQGVVFTWPFIPTLLIAWVLNWSDSVFIAHFGSMSEVGIYAMSYKISMVYLILTGAFALAYQPFFFRKANQDDQEEARRSIYSIIHIASRAFILIAFVLALFSRDIVDLLLDNKFQDTYILIRVILLSHVFSSVMGISSNLYYLQSKKSKLQFLVVTTSAVVNLMLNFLLVPHFGMFGAASATVMSMIVLTVMHYYFARTCYFIPIFWGKLSLLIATSVAIVLFFQFGLEGSWVALPFKIVFLAFLVNFILKNQELRFLVNELKIQ